MMDTNLCFLFSLCFAAIGRVNLGEEFAVLNSRKYLGGFLGPYFLLIFLRWRPPSIIYFRDGARTDF